MTTTLPTSHQMKLFEIDLVDNPQTLCGVDEAGRGALAGPVFAAAVILGDMPTQGLADSKVLSAKKRDYMASQIKEQALYWAVASSSPQEIDEINILQASFLAMDRAVQQVIQAGAQPSRILVDGHLCPSFTHIPPSQIACIIQGDKHIAAISAASILAKVARDQYLMDMHNRYPHYAFASHKGYPTQKHLALLLKYGVFEEYRRSYKPVQWVLSQT